MLRVIMCDTEYLFIGSFAVSVSPLAGVYCDLLLIFLKPIAIVLIVESSGLV